MAAAGLALLLGGATGNVTDRIVHGAVTGLLRSVVRYLRYPAFNVADSAIAIGAALILLTYYSVAGPKRPTRVRERHSERKSVSRWNGFNRREFLSTALGAACYTAP